MKSSIHDQLSKRLANLRKALKKNDIEALLVTDKNDVFYLSNFPSPTDAKLIVTQKTVLLITDPRYKDETIDPLLKKIIVTQKKDWEAVGEQLKYIKSIHYTPYKITVSGLKTWKKKTKGKSLRKFVAAKTDFISELRMIKDNDEIASIQKAQTITENALISLKAHIKPGMTELDLAQKLKIALFKAGSEELSFDPIVASGPNAALPHAKPTSRKIRKNEVILIDCGAVYQRYHGDMTRIFVIGELSDKCKHAFLAVEEAYHAAFSSIQKNILLKDIDLAARSSLEKHELKSGSTMNTYFTHSTGHGVGLYIHEQPGISIKSKGKLQPGMVFSIEPGVYFPGKWGIRLENLVYIDKQCKAVNLNLLPFMIAVTIE